MPPTGPEFFGFPTANVALWVSFFAAAFAGGSLWYVRRTFRRAGARIKVDFDPDTTVMWSGTPTEHVPTVTATNSGLAAVQAKNLYFEVRREKEKVLPRGFLHETLPTTVAGFSQTMWVLAPEGLPKAGTRKVRAVVQLAGMRPRKSKWVTLADRADDTD